jgi:hypothetical protein
MTVRLRVAGIYYDESFDFDKLPAVPAFAIPGRVAPSTNEPTIFELLEAAKNGLSGNTHIENFNYVFERRGPALSMTSLCVTHKKDVNPSLGDKIRPAGLYQLTEMVIPGGVAAWQVYVYREGKSTTQLDPESGSGYSPADIRISPKKPRGFTPFDQTILKSGDEVIFRLIGILRGPIIPFVAGKQPNGTAGTVVMEDDSVVKESSKLKPKK